MTTRAPSPCSAEEATQGKPTDEELAYLESDDIAAMTISWPEVQRLAAELRRAREALRDLLMICGEAHSESVYNALEEIKSEADAVLTEEEIAAYERVCKAGYIADADEGVVINIDRLLAALRASQAERDEARKIQAIAIDNHREAREAFQLVREVVEDLASPGAVADVIEPPFMLEAEALVKGIRDIDLRAEAAERERDALREALVLIASFGGKTLFGPEWDDERLHQRGAASAFEQCADIARAALAQRPPVKEE